MHASEVAFPPQDPSYFASGEERKIAILDSPEGGIEPDTGASRGSDSVKEGRAIELQGGP